MALLVAGMLFSPVSGSPVAFADTTTVSAEASSAVEQAYEQWSRGLGVRQSCSSGVSIVFEELSGRRGEYRTGSGEVVIDPTDATTGIGAIVAHELSHHTFLACGVFADTEFTDAFYAAQGLPAGRDWFDYGTGWAQTPAEHFAEAMATVIVGSGEGGIHIAGETTDLVSRWLAGAPLATTPAAEHQPEPYATGGTVAAPVEVDDRDGELPRSSQEPVSSAAEPVPAEAEAPVEPAADLVVPQLTVVKVFWLYSWRVAGPM